MWYYLCDGNCSTNSINTNSVIIQFDVAIVSPIQRIGCQPEKTALHGGQSRSWSAEQGKKIK